MQRSRLLSATCLSLLFLASPALAQTVKVKVSAKSGPWIESANKKTPYGVGDQAPPTLVPLGDSAGLKVEIIPAEATTQVDGKPIGPEGIGSIEADDLRGFRKKVYPSLYVPKALYPVHPHALIAAFVDAEGKTVSRPFPVGTGVRLEIPDDAKSLALGFNDITFAPNQGELEVTVVLP